jgi:hypothetical protein
MGFQQNIMKQLCQTVPQQLTTDPLYENCGAYLSHKASAHDEYENNYQIVTIYLYH